jgi:hypothetical protein
MECPSNLPILLATKRPILEVWEKWHAEQCFQKFLFLNDGIWLPTRSFFFFLVNYDMVQGLQGLRRPFFLEGKKTL